MGVLNFRVWDRIDRKMLYPSSSSLVDVSNFLKSLSRTAYAVDRYIFLKSVELLDKTDWLTGPP